MALIRALTVSTIAFERKKEELYSFWADCKVTNVPPLLENGVFLTDFQTNANIFNEFFVNQCPQLPNDSHIPACSPNVITLYQVLLLIDHKFYR